MKNRHAHTHENLTPKIQYFQAQLSWISGLGRFQVLPGSLGESLVSGEDASFERSAKMAFIGMRMG